MKNRIIGSKQRNVAKERIYERKIEGSKREYKARKVTTGRSKHVTVVKDRG